MSDNVKRKSDPFYLNGIKLLVNKFLCEVSNKETSIGKLHEGVERKFEVWAQKYIADKQIKEDVWRGIAQVISNKNGGY